MTLLTLKNMKTETKTKNLFARAVMTLVLMLLTTTAWAQYSPIYLSLDKNDGSGIVNAIPVSYDYVNGNYHHTLSATFYTREGRHIVGWSLGPTLAAKYGANETIVLTESLTLYAIWDDTTTRDYILSIPSTVTATLRGNNYTNTLIGVDENETVSLSYTGDVAEGKSVHYTISGILYASNSVLVTYPGANNADGKSATLKMPAFDITLAVGTPNDFAIPNGITIEETYSMNGSLLHAIIDGSSLETISIPTPISVSEVRLNRTFTPGKPATLMLPFNTTYWGEEHHGAAFHTFTGVTFNETTQKWEATMTELDKGDGVYNGGTLVANTPYIVMPTASSITLQNGGTLCTAEGGGQETKPSGSNWTFKGTYSYKEWIADGANSDEIGKAYGFAGVPNTGIEVGDFVRVASGAKIRPMGCYLLWSDTPNAARRMTRSASVDELPSRITVRLVGSNGETTSIGELDTATGEITFDGWWTMDGIRLSGKPAKRGIYINNGKKIVIK
jgi:hypothetical protein